MWGRPPQARNLDRDRVAQGPPAQSPVPSPVDNHHIRDIARTDFGNRLASASL